MFLRPLASTDSQVTQGPAHKVKSRMARVGFLPSQGMQTEVLRTYSGQAQARPQKPLLSMVRTIVQCHSTDSPSLLGDHLGQHSPRTRKNCIC